MLPRILPLRRLLPAVRAQPLSTSAACAAKHKQMPPRPKPPPEDEIEEMFVKGTGPGGQKINKTNSAVQLRHIPTGIVVKSQATRSRSENRAIARGLLALRLEEIRNPETCRTAALAAAKIKKRANATKKARRKYKKLAGKDNGEADEQEAEKEDDQSVEGQVETIEESATGQASEETSQAREGAGAEKGQTSQ